jgi:hypothetical protein
MSCVIAGAAIERGRLPPLEVTAGLGALRLITVVTDDATCWRPIRGSAGVLCSTGSIYNPNRYYIAWAELPGGSVSVYPNPSTTGQLTLLVQGAGAVTSAQAVLLNGLGQVVRTQAGAVRGGAAEAPLAVQGLAHGVYTLRLQIGEHTITRKVVLE